MLGKLIKYDLKAVNRFLIIMHAFLLLSAILGRFFLIGRIRIDSLENMQLILAISFVTYLLLFIGICYGTYLVIAVRFYKNLFSDEGYLTNTLPVSKTMHLFSKTVSGSIWMILDILLIYLSGYILLSVPLITDTLQGHETELVQMMGFGNTTDFNRFLLYLLVISIIGAVGNVIMMYACIAVGQLFKGHKVLGAVVSYFVLTAIISLFTTVVSTINGLTGGYLDNNGDSPASFAHYMNQTLNFSFILLIITSVILYLLTYWIMKKKVNLD